MKNSAKVYSKLDPYLAVNEAGAVDGTPQGARFARVNRGLTKREGGARAGLSQDAILNFT